MNLTGNPFLNGHTVTFGRLRWQTNLGFCDGKTNWGLLQTAAAAAAARFAAAHSVPVKNPCKNDIYIFFDLSVVPKKKVSRHLKTPVGWL